MSLGSAGGRPLVIGVAGGTGSDKSTVAAAMADAAPGQVLVLPQDVYYRRATDPYVEGRAVINWDEPGAFDTPFLVEQLDALAEGEAIDRPLYDFEASDRLPETLRLGPSPDAPYFQRLGDRVLIHAPDPGIERAGPVWRVGGWFRVCIVDGTCGYVPEEAVRPAGAPR